MLEPAGFASTLLTIPLYPLKADATRGEAISIAPTDCWRLSRPKWLTLPGDNYPGRSASTILAGGERGE